MMQVDAESIWQDVQAIRSAAPQIIRGNASEIVALVGSQTSTKGVDATIASGSALDAAWALSRSSDSVVSISGDVDYVVWREQQAAIHNGHPMMSRVTGLGCTATATL
ncbi:MAG: hydroxyethylthiazole kinase [Armatimonadota bacterium]